MRSACINPTQPSPLALDASERVEATANESSLDPVILMVDDEPINTSILTAFLQDCGYRRLLATTESTDALALIQREVPDVVILDLKMPRVNGFNILAAMKTMDELKSIPVVILTAATDGKSKLLALELGASDFLGKPVDPSELRLRLRNVLAVKAYQDRLSNYSASLEEQVQLRTRQLDAAHRQIIGCLARASEFRDDDTGHHVSRVGRYSEVISQSLGCDPEFCDQIQIAAQLHDVGKIGIPDSVLLKPGRLDAQEYALMRGHCDLGAYILHSDDSAELSASCHTLIGAKIMENVPDSPIMQLAASIAFTHHERWDGTGYPRRLKGEQIPLEGRIVAVADVYDALNSKRPYKDAWSPEKCFEVLQEERGQQFDPTIIDAVLAAKDQILAVRDEIEESTGSANQT